MERWAAVDLLDGHVVTLVEGRPSARTTWNETPSAFAARWRNEGADGIHVVDLDAAFGKGSNRDEILKILRSSDVPVQVGGGVRSLETAKRWLNDGAARVVLGTMAYREPRAIEELLRESGPERVVVAADYKDGRVMSGGWTVSERTGLLDSVREFEEFGVSYLLATAVGRDGTAAGPDVATTKRICAATKMRVIASGGIRDSRDVADLESAGAHSVVLGRALYEGTVRLGEAGAR